jgi:hypothetical protein
MVSPRMLSGGRIVMKKVEDYMRHAAECRQMAKRARTPDEHEMHMANTWEALAADREAHLARQPPVWQSISGVLCGNGGHRGGSGVSRLAVACPLPAVGALEFLWGYGEVHNAGFGR